jgi:hypothetical protein
MGQTQQMELAISQILLSLHKIKIKIVLLIQQKILHLLLILQQILVILPKLLIKLIRIQLIQQYPIKQRTKSKILLQTTHQPLIQQTRQ